MQIRYQVDVAAPVVRFGKIEGQAVNFSPVLRRWGGYFKAQAKKRADAAEGWPPLAESTKKRLEHTRTSAVTAQAKVRKGYGGALERYLIRQQQKEEAQRQFAWATKRGLGKLAGVSSVRGATKGSPSADLAELRRLQAGGRVDRVMAGKRGNKVRAAAWQGSKAVARLRKQLLQAELQREKGKRATVGGDRRRSQGHKLLGRVARQIQWDAEGSKVLVYSRVPFSGVHNEGGSAGNRAVEPKRPFLLITDADKVMLSTIVLQHLMGK